jgi:hypothetical protein
VVTILVALVVLGTAVWVDQDARKLLAAGATKEQLGNSPITWGIATILVWIIVFPWYLSKRGKILRELGILPIAQVAVPTTDAMPSPGSLPQSGWYADPTNALQKRFWDGNAWTEQVRVAPPQTGSGPF